MKDRVHRRELLRWGTAAGLAAGLGPASDCILVGEKPCPR